MPTWVTHGGIRCNYQSGFEWLVDVLNDHQQHAELIDNCKTHASQNYRYGQFVARLESGLLNCIAAHKNEHLTPIGQCNPITNDALCLLPFVDLGFENYSGVAKFYVSHDLNNQRLLSSKVVAIEHIHKEQWTVVNDPCWPAEKKLSDEQKQLLSELKSPIEFARFDKKAQGIIWQLLTDGFVVFA
jgi:hypothetical protein